MSEAINLDLGIEHRIAPLQRRVAAVLSAACLHPRMVARMNLRTVRDWSPPIRANQEELP